jgi:hypothetical protein
MMISGSRRVRKDPDSPIPAIERFDGAFARQIRKYYNQLRNIDIIFVSPVYGIVRAEEKIGFKESVGWDWRHLIMDECDAEKLREANLKMLQKVFSQVRYSEIYINVGKEVLKLLPNIEGLVSERTKIIYSKGAMGQKMVHTKKWIESQISLK